MAYETSIEYVTEYGFASFYSDEPKYVRYVRKLAKDYPDEVTITQDNQWGIGCRVPIKWVKPPKPPIKRKMTDEQRKAVGERLKQCREASETM